SVETTELMYDIQCERFRLRPDSGGAGRYRGGLGIEKDIRFLVDCIVSARTDRWVFPPGGIRGGSSGAPGAYVLQPDQPDEVRLPSKFGEYPVHAGQVMSFRTVGGGGYGPPMERDPGLVLDDVRSGKVSIEAARRDYGVVVAGSAPRSDMTVDQAGTDRLRAGVQS
ncbi:MAG: hydantoinase B/oxoprolinase family protein, partial [Acidimicrobiales bacterium]|nr:hydantoinase B/oxoprolinase family protein [Acidimicrobiales bacterium]